MQEFCESIKTENTYPKSIENEIIRHMRILAASSGAEILKSFSEIQKDNFSNGLFFNCSLEKVMGDIQKVFMILSNINNFVNQLQDIHVVHFRPSPKASDDNLLFIGLPAEALA